MDELAKLKSQKQMLLSQGNPDVEQLKNLTKQIDALEQQNVPNSNAQRFNKTSTLLGMPEDSMQKPKREPDMSVYSEPEPRDMVRQVEEGDPKRTADMQKGFQQGLDYNIDNEDDLWNKIKSSFGYDKGQ